MSDTVRDSKIQKLENEMEWLKDRFDELCLAVDKLQMGGVVPEPPGGDAGIPTPPDAETTKATEMLTSHSTIMATVRSSPSHEARRAESPLGVVYQNGAWCAKISVNGRTRHIQQFSYKAKSSELSQREAHLLAMIAVDRWFIALGRPGKTNWARGVLPLHDLLPYIQPGGKYHTYFRPLELDNIEIWLNDHRHRDRRSTAGSDFLQTHNLILDIVGKAPIWFGDVVPEKMRMPRNMDDIYYQGEKPKRTSLSR